MSLFLKAARGRLSGYRRRETSEAARDLAGALCETKGRILTSEEPDGARAHLSKFNRGRASEGDKGEMGQELKKIAEA